MPLYGVFDLGAPLRGLSRWGGALRLDPLFLLTVPLYGVFLDLGAPLRGLSRSVPPVGSFSPAEEGGRYKEDEVKKVIRLE